jgi:uncharacterized protein
MRIGTSAGIVAAAIASAAAGQSLGDGPADIAVDGVRFTRALNGAAEASSVGGGAVTITSGAKRDFFREPDGSAVYANAPVLLTAIDNAKPFTFTVRVAPDLTQTYDAGAVYLWARDDLWLKMALEQDERGRSRMVTVRTAGTSDDNNHDVVGGGAVHMRVSSDTKSIGFYYSADAKSWQLIRVFRNDYPATLWIGLSAQSPTGDGNRARFDRLTLTETAISDFRMGQ